jgi:hypothetical protein
VSFHSYPQLLNAWIQYHEGHSPQPHHSRYIKWGFQTAFLARFCVIRCNPHSTSTFCLHLGRNLRKPQLDLNLAPLLLAFVSVRDAGSSRMYGLRITIKLKTNTR